MTQNILTARDITKEFKGFLAVQGFDLDVRRGSIHALIGPNGAGKTTVFHMLTKFLQPTQGEVRYKQRDITRMRPAAVARLGMVRSFQISAVFTHMTVRDNVKVALQRKLGSSFFFWRSSASLAQLDGRAEQLIASVGLSDVIDRPARDLSYGRRRALEIATTLALDPDLLLLDEPMAGLGREDIGKVSGLIRSLKGSRTVLMVEHNLSVVADLSDVITVMARGRKIAEGTYDEVSRDAQVRSAYIGSEHA